jgi:hypothetical protein
MRLRRICAGLPPRCGPWEAGPEAELHACRGAAMGGAVMRPATAAAAVSSQPRAARNCPQRAAGRSLRGQRRCRSCESCMCPALFKCQRHGGSSSCRRCAQPWCGKGMREGPPTRKRCQRRHGLRLQHQRCQRGVQGARHHRQVWLHCAAGNARQRDEGKGPADHQEPTMQR